MARIGELDLPDRLAPTIPVWVTQIGVAVLCLGAAGLMRNIVNITAPAASPFALLFPAVMVATLFARWVAGAITGVISTLFAWYFVLPVQRSFTFANPSNQASIFVIAVAALLTVVFADLFRRAVRRAARERDREIADRDLFLAEFDHRVKNNFAIVASLLDLQRRRSADPGTEAALTTALNRVESIAQAHRHLYRDAGQPGMVQIKEYMADLCSALADALLLRGTITLSCETESAVMPRDRAVSIGLVVNELVTNAAKHAFAGRDAGRIVVTFRVHPDGSTLTVSDNGVGMPKKARAPSKDGGLGTRLIEAFARQAGGELSTDSDPTGTVVTLELGD